MVFFIGSVLLFKEYRFPFSKDGAGFSGSLDNATCSVDQVFRFQRVHRCVHRIGLLFKEYKVRFSEVRSWSFWIIG
jgi:hypothetical protein